MIILTAPGSKTSQIMLLMTCNGIRCVYWQSGPPRALNYNSIQASDLYVTKKNGHGTRPFNISRAIMYASG